MTFKNTLFFLLPLLLLLQGCKKAPEEVTRTPDTEKTDRSLTEELNAYVPEGWNPNFLAALDQARKEDKYLLLDFTGSDWCVWCERLRDEVFYTEEFKAWADKNAVLVFLDFPSGIQLSESQVQQNIILQQFFGIQGYPTIWLMDNDLTPMLVTGYQEGGAEAYIRHLEEDNNIDPTKIEDFKNAFTEVIETNLEPLGL